ncbi:MAG: helix-turn-helix transcriptional regulator [Clostridia bacterium]|nr:helix-turn-helix transcriptional regulator [Clostridia bacterium]
MEFSERVKALRRESKLSQAELADQIGVSQQCISEWERGKTEPTLTFIVKLSDIFNVSADYIVCRTNHK